MSRVTYLFQLCTQLLGGSLIKGSSSHTIEKRGCCLHIWLPVSGQQPRLEKAQLLPYQAAADKFRGSSRADERAAAALPGCGVRVGETKNAPQLPRMLPQSVYGVRVRIQDTPLPQQPLPRLLSRPGCGKQVGETLTAPPSLQPGYSLEVGRD